MNLPQWLHARPWSDMYQKSNIDITTYVVCIWRVILHRHGVYKYVCYAIHCAHVIHSILPSEWLYIFILPSHLTSILLQPWHILHSSIALSFLSHLSLFYFGPFYTPPLTPYISPTATPHPCTDLAWWFPFWAGQTLSGAEGCLHLLQTSSPQLQTVLHIHPGAGLPRIREHLSIYIILIKKHVKYVSS